MQEKMSEQQLLLLVDSCSESIDRCRERIEACTAKADEQSVLWNRQLKDQYYELKMKLLSELYRRGGIQRIPTFERVMSTPKAGDDTPA